MVEQNYKRKVFIIAEAGVNHNGSLKIAKKMVDAAVRAGADAIKFQTFCADDIVIKSAPSAAYQKKGSAQAENQFEMLKKLELSLDAHKELIRYCKDKGIIFLSTPFSLQGIDLLKKLGLKIFKIPSGEITNLPYLRKIGSLKKEVILSTGMSSLNEVKQALDVLLRSGTKKDDITVLHCNTEYPTPLQDVNLLAMLSIKKSCGVKVGYSDHTLGIEISIAAVALGAEIIEKHFTLNKAMFGPDHKASLVPYELALMIKAVRKIELALGSGIKKPSTSEAKNRLVVRKSIVALKDIKKGEKFSQSNIGAKRPGLGINPMEWDQVIGKSSRSSFLKDEFIRI
jgi:N,N'-diacetyllegionaminate synthase